MASRLLPLTAAFTFLALPSRATGPDEFERYMRAAVELHKSLEYERALEQLARARKSAGSVEQNVRVAIHEGLVRADMGDWEQARAAFKTALLLDPAATLPPKVSPKVERELEEVRKEVKLQLVEASARAPPAPEPGEAPPSTAGWAWLPGAVGAVGLAGGAVLFFQSEDRYRRLAGTEPLSLEESVRLRDDGARLQAAGWGGLGVGIAGLTVAVSLLLLGPPDEESLAFGLTPSPGGAVLGVSGALP